jgi:hypothetical protein
VPRWYGAALNAARAGPGDSVPRIQGPQALNVHLERARALAAKAVHVHLGSDLAAAPERCTCTLPLHLNVHVHLAAKAADTQELRSALAY